MSTISAGTSITNALVQTGDTTGQLVLQTNNGTTAVTIGTDQTVTLAAALPVASGGTGLTSAGSNGNVLTSNGTSWTSSAKITSGTALAYNWNGLTTNTVLDFTGIPSWVKRIMVLFQGISTSGTSNYQVQIGSTTFSTSSYACGFSYISSAVASSNATSGFVVSNPSGAACVISGIMTLALVGSNTWVASYSIGQTDSARTMIGGGVSPALAGALDRVRLTTVNGTDTFDAGSVNILYE